MLYSHPNRLEKEELEVAVQCLHRAMRDLRDYEQHPIVRIENTSPRAIDLPRELVRQTIIKLYGRVTNSLIHKCYQGGYFSNMDNFEQVVLFVILPTIYEKVK